MRFTTPLLSSAALLAMGTVGFAADLPSKKAAPVEYVRVCSQFGAGFFFIPGTDTCLKVGGRVRAEYNYAEPMNRGSNTTSMFARGYVVLDSYTPTDWGPLRATTRIFSTRVSGRGGVGGAAILNANATTNSDVTLEWAYIQFAGITAGRLAASFFNFAPFGGGTYAGGNALGRGEDYGSIDALAYTFQSGGFLATLALEDGTERRIGINSVGSDMKFVTTGPSYGGHVMPDVVGRLDYSGSWGQAVLTGAVHQTRTGASSTTATNIFNNGALGDTVYGFAVQGGVKINLPMIAPGDALFLQAAYADGANSYTGWSTTGIGTYSTVASNDVIYDANGKGHTSKSMSVAGSLVHYWMPTVLQRVFVGYGKLDQYGINYDYAALSVGTQVAWQPVKDFEIGVEVGYQKLTDAPKSVVITPDVHKDNYFGRIRFQRTF